MRYTMTTMAAVLCAAALPCQEPKGLACDVDTAFAAALPPLAEARWTLIPWRHSLTDALVEAKQTNRPIYLYVNDGDVDSGRC
ncbi:MAG TPA: hypothetical protein VF384_04030 [Planctomycetota bacterium]